MVNARVLGALALTMLVFAGASRFSRSSEPSVVFLHQGWSDAERQNFYYLPQGTVMLPASWLAALRSPDGTPFTSDAHMRSLGFIVDHDKTPSNPYGWPIGFAITTSSQTQGIPMMGFTCAACHTSQLTYRGTVMRVEGGQANVDLDRFKRDLTGALLATGASDTARTAFEARAVSFGFPQKAIDAQFRAKYAAVIAGAPERRRIAATATAAGPGRNDALSVIAEVLFNYGIGVPTNTNRATAPVDFPYLWNITNLDWVQYNASVHQPMARNIGEAIGVGAITHFVNPTTSAMSPVPERWRTSILLRNLHVIEDQLDHLQPPVWPQDVLGRIDATKATRGRALFSQRCAGCHAVYALAGSANDEWAVRTIKLDRIGTDPNQAENFKSDTYDGTKFGLSKHERAGPGLQVVTSAIRTQGYIDEGIPRSEWSAYDGFGRSNVLSEPCGYKPRPLVGVWATPAFLHNGSVPTVYDLLSDSRPARFRVGSTEYDPVHLGFRQPPPGSGFLFDASLNGNSNAGHWFTDDGPRKGRIGPRLTEAQKYDIIEYLKMASYANYPRVVVHQHFSQPCVAENKL